VKNKAGRHLNGEVKMSKKREGGEMFLSLRNLRTKVVVAHPWKAWEPSRSHEEDCNFLQPGSIGHFVQEGGEVEELVLDHIEELWLVNQAIHSLFIRPEVLEGSKYSVPDRKESTVVLVQAISV